MRPAGRKPLSRSSSHSYVRTLAARVVDCTPSPVLRQKRSLPSSAGTVICAGGELPSLTVKICPDNAFSGRPPSLGGLNRGSRHVPVQAGLGSILALACVSL